MPIANNQRLSWRYAAALFLFCFTGASSNAAVTEWWFEKVIVHTQTADNTATAADTW